MMKRSRRPSRPRSRRRLSSFFFAARAPRAALLPPSATAKRKQTLVLLLLTTYRVSLATFPVDGETSIPITWYYLNHQEQKLDAD